MNVPPLYNAWNADNRGYGSSVEHPKTQIAGIQFSHDRPYFFLIPGYYCLYKCLNYSWINLYNEAMYNLSKH